MFSDDYNLYKTFITIFEEKSISKAASKLYVSQPAISYNLKVLERNIGYKLFIRTPKGIEPTNEANELYKYVVSGFNVIEEGKNRLNEINNLEYGSIRIGTPSHIGIFLLTNIIKQFKELYPDVEIEIYNRSTTRLVELLETRKIDILIDMLPVKLDDCNLNKEIISEVDFCFAYSKKYFKNIRITDEKDLLKYPLILQETNSSYNKDILEFMQVKGLNIKPSITSWSSEMTIEFIRQGLGIGYVLKDLVDIQLDKSDFKVITFDNSLPKVSICAVYNNELLSPAQKKFISLLNNK